MNLSAHKILNTQRSRVSDKHGKGHYGASRGSRLHKGLDIACKTGEQIFSPIPAKIVRKSTPYAEKKYAGKNISIRYTGLLLQGIKEWKGYEIKIWYFKPLKTSGTVASGEVLGRVQDLTKLYPGITNHIHIEVKKNGAYINPFNIWQVCF